MFTWTYTIKTANGFVLTTTNSEVAENKSKLGCRVHCKRTSNIFKFRH
ncbi:MAG: hypothetical protein QCH96_04235 [Candidatus Thermoplasmatota archaeon]|nr:hypothetical protein [Candidatus Thermoplasmatota archaeon]